MSKEPELLPMREIQQRLNISKTTLWRLMKQERFKVYSNPRDRRQKLLDIHEVEAALQPELIEDSYKGKAAA